MAELEEKILQDAAYRPIVFHDQDPHTVLSAAREIPAVVDAQGRTNRHDFQGLSLSSVALPGWKSGQFLSDGQKVGGHPVTAGAARAPGWRSEEHTSELQSHSDLVCRLLLEKKKIACWILEILREWFIQIRLTKTVAYWE